MGSFVDRRKVTTRAVPDAEVLRDVIRELVRNDGLYGGAPCWDEGSPCADAFAWAMADG